MECTRTFTNADETARFAAHLGPQLSSGDTLLLSGPVGAGKSHFARALILSILAQPEDVPSPTFTLVQSYDTVCGPLVHADLYRLTGHSEIEELGLANAMDHEICLIEWPDRLGPYYPETALSIDLTPGTEPEHRFVTLRWTDAKWNKRVA